jgi:adenylate cyclase
MVEQIAGDVVTAIWSESTSDSPRHAAMAARQIVQVTEALLASRRPVSETSRAQPLALGIGLEFGSVLLGSYGPASRRAHVALGDAVNVAAQLQTLTADLSVPVLLGPRIAERLPADVLESLGDYLLEGFERPTELFALADWRDFAAGDPMWARSATALGDSAADTGRWAKWRVASPDAGEPHRSGDYALDLQARAKQ